MSRSSNNARIAQQIENENLNMNLTRRIQNEYNLYGTSPTENRLVSNQRKEEMKKSMNQFFEKKKRQNRINLLNTVREEINLYNNSPTLNKLPQNHENKKWIESELKKLKEEKRRINEENRRIKEEKRRFNEENRRLKEEKRRINEENRRLKEEKRRINEEKRLNEERRRIIQEKLKNINRQQNEARKRDPRYYPGNEYFEIAREKARRGNSPFLGTR